MNNQMTSRQTACICCLSFLALKLVALPSILSRFANGNAIIVALIMFAFELLFLYIFLKAKDKYPHYSLYEILCKFVGKIIAKIIYVFLGLIFFCKMSLLLNEGVVYMKNIVDEEFKIVLFLFTFLPVITAMVYSGIRSTARTCEFGYVFVFVGVIICLFLAKIDLNFNKIGPFYPQNIQNMLKTCFDTSFWFTDFLFIFVLSDKIKKQKNMKRTIFVFVITIEVIVIIFYAIYFRLFKETGYIHETAIADITQYKKNIGNVGNADIIETLVYLVTIFLHGSIYLTCLCNIFSKITNDYNIFHSLIFNDLVIIVVQCIVVYNLEMFINFATTYLNFSSILVWGIIPVFYILLFIFDRRKNVKTYKRKIASNKT